MYGIQFIPKSQTFNSPVSYAGASDTVTTAQSVLLLAGKAGTDGLVNGVVARYVDYGVVIDTDAAGNFKLRRYSDFSGNPADADRVDATYGLLGHSGSPGGYLEALVGGYNLGAPNAEATNAILAATTMPAAASATGILAATALTASAQTITTGITNPSGLVPTIVGNDTDMGGNVIITYTDLNGVSGLTLQLALNGTTTVVPTLDQIPTGVHTIESIYLPPYSVDASETVSVGTKGLVVIAGLTNPDVPRVASITGSATGIVSVQEVLGLDANGAMVHDSITANGTTTVNGVKALATTTAVLIGPLNATGNTMAFGLSDILGLPYRMDHDGFLQASFGNTHEATRATVTFDGVNLCGNTVLLNSSMDGSTSVTVDFIRSDAPVGFTTGS